jgi:hypothetical protein
VESALIDFVINLLAALVGALGTYVTVRLKRQVRQRALDRAVRLFFGFPGRVVIVHSAVRDETPEGHFYSYPATDTRAAQTLAKLFESIGLRTERDFIIHPDRSDRQLSIGELSRCNIVLLCGPARNGIFAMFAAVLPMRYSMEVGDDGRNVLVDRLLEQRLRSSRQLSVHSGLLHDYGLVASLPSPYNPSRRLVILAGIHRRRYGWRGGVRRRPEQPPGGQRPS